jgi:hypothetical protein
MLVMCTRKRRHGKISRWRKREGKQQAGKGMNAPPAMTTVEGGRKKAEK